MMNNSNIHKCPICEENNNLDDEFCLNCSWELIDIPKNTSKCLVDYFTNKIERHKNIYTQRTKDVISIKKINNENYNNLEIIDRLNIQLKAISKDNANLKQNLDKNKDLDEQLNSYIRRYGGNWISNKAQTNKEIVNVNWELKNNQLILTSQFKNLQQELHQLVILFKQDSKPNFGSFDIALLSDCMFDNNNVTVIIDTNKIPKGSYFIKPISLVSKDKNILLFHKDQSLSPNNFDWNKTKISI